MSWSDEAKELPQNDELRQAAFAAEEINDSLRRQIVALRIELAEATSSNSKLERQVEDLWRVIRFMIDDRDDD